MSAPTLILCLAGDLSADPASLVEAIQEDPDTLSMIRRYGRGEADYEEVLEAVNAIV